MGCFNRNELAAASLAACVVFSACGKKKKEDASGEPAKSAAQLVLTVTNQIVQADIAKYKTSSLTKSLQAENTFGGNSVSLVANNEMDSTYWSTASTLSNLYCRSNGCGTESNNASAKDYIDDQLNPDFKNFPETGRTSGAAVGLMGRLTSSMKFACAMSYMLGEGGLPAAQTTKVLATNALLAPANTACGSDLKLDSEPLDVTFTVTELTGQFSRKINIKSAAFENNLYLYDDGFVKRVMNGESHDQDGAKQISRYFIEYDANAKIGKFEGFERTFITTASQQGGFYFYRATVNNNTSDVTIFGFAGGTGMTGSTLHFDNGTLFVGRGNFNQAPASWGISEINTSSTTNELRSGHPLIGCISMTDGSFTSAGACSTQALTAADMTTAYSTITDKVLAKSATTDWNTSDTISALSFSASDILSANPTN